MRLELDTTLSSSESGSIALERIIFKLYDLITHCGKFGDVGQVGMNDDNWRNLALFKETGTRRWGTVVPPADPLRFA